MSDKVIVKNDGSPFSTHAAALLVLRKKKLPETEYTVREIEDGFGIVKIPVPIPEDLLEDDEFAVSEELSTCDYAWVQISPPSGAHDLKKVPLTCNGACILASRSVPVCLPRSYIGILDDAIITDHRAVDDPDGTPLVTERLRFPYNYLRVGTRKEFEKLFAGA